jgi:hypothetical protein
MFTIGSVVKDPGRMETMKRIYVGLAAPGK